MLRALTLALVVPIAAGCAMTQRHGGSVVGAAGGLMMASELGLLQGEYLAGALITLAIYDPLAPTWDIRTTRLDEERVRLDLTMKALATGGDGEARQVFLRNAHTIAREGGFAGFEIVRFEEGVESTRPFARRVASGEILLARRDG